MWHYPKYLRYSKCLGFPRENIQMYNFQIQKKFRFR